MSERIDLVYDRLVAEEKLKRGRKYERLAAIVFKLLREETTIHDLRLRGSTGARHQIDVIVGDDRKHVLIEAKDYAKKVGLPLVRNFWAAVEDLGADEAFVVTTVSFTEPAVTYAAGKNIQLAVLRPPNDEDWQGFIRRVVLTLHVTAQTGLPSIAWDIPENEVHLVDSSAVATTQTEEIRLSNEAGEFTEFYPLLVRQLSEDHASVPLGGHAELGRRNPFPEPTWLHLPGQPAVRVLAWTWKLNVATVTTEHVVGDAVGDLAAELVLKTLDGSIRRMFSGRDIQQWIFDGRHVAPRTGDTRAD